MKTEANPHVGQNTPPQSHRENCLMMRVEKCSIRDSIFQLSDIDPGPSSRGEKFADWIYENLGSWRFILVQSILVAFWVILNATAYVQTWDPYPFIFMNVIISLQSAYTVSLKSICLVRGMDQKTRTPS
ncbi:MAG: hypothetical protein A4E49_02953 [Methanosaeta sp. PtaU1.Bin112]|nr:MAG: hypothetical protein A4E49_02953 [Methanosaeta sp. PtaU1.Bin112]